MVQVKEITEDIKGSAQKVWLAGLGALAVTEEEGSKLFNSLVAKGEKFESRRKDDLETVKGKADEALEALGDGWTKLESAVDQRVSKALGKLGLPSRKEIQGLSKRVEELTAKLNALETEPAPKKRVSRAKKTSARKTSKGA